MKTSLFLIVATAAVVSTAHLVTTVNDPIREAYNNLLDRYYGAKNTISDINEHIPTLYQYALNSDSIIECGVRSVISTWAFARGLYERKLSGASNHVSLVGIELYTDKKIFDVANMASILGLQYTFYEGNDLKYNLNGEVDTVFIDTWHVYGQLKRELAKFAPYVKKWIILHDTTVDAVYGESIRSNFDMKAQSALTGIPVHEISKGLWPAVEEFLEANTNFVIEARYKNNNGLTILKRVYDDVSLGDNDEL